MVEGCSNARGAPQLKIIDVNLNSEKHCEILSDIIIPLGEQTYNGECRFQQNYGSSVTSAAKN